jgi:hypothetical protein
MVDVNLPAFYVLSQDIDEKQIPAVLSALDLTPVVCAFVTDAKNIPLAYKFSRDVYRTRNFDDARSFALQVSTGAHRAPLIVGHDASCLTAHYADGTTQEVPL